MRQTVLSESSSKVTHHKDEPHDVDEQRCTEAALLYHRPLLAAGDGVVVEQGQLWRRSRMQSNH
jgi:hypothetical protein